MKPYIVRQGDYLTKLADKMGFSAKAVWDDAKNADLKARRVNMDILAPGDIVYVPDAKPKGLPITAGTTNKYVARVSRVTINLILQKDGQILADEPYVIEGLGVPVPGKSSPEGKVSFDISVHVREVQLVLTRRDMAHTVLIGEMDPLDQPSGVKKRLSHLGFLVWRPEVEARTSDLLSSEGPFDLVERLRRSGGIDDDELQRAIEAFQRAEGLKPTGAMDAATREALGAAHGS